MTDGGLDLDALVANDCVAVDSEGRLHGRGGLSCSTREDVGLTGCEGDQKEEDCWSDA